MNRMDEDQAAFKQLILCKFKMWRSTAVVPLDGTHLDVVRGLVHQEVFTQVRQWEELVGVTQLRSIRTNRFSLICLCQGPDSR